MWRAVDREFDEHDLAAGNTIRCPVLVHWGADGDLFEWFDLPDALSTSLRSFLTG